MSSFSWRDIWRQNFTSVQDLAVFCQIPECDMDRLVFRPSFPLSVPRRLAEKMKKGAIDDPLFRQFVPLVEEMVQTKGFEGDPLLESSSRCCDKLLHKYEGRALLVTTKSCGMHCRFCFRRHFPYACSKDDFSQELTWLESHPDIDEVILSGGDPLAMPERDLEDLLDAIDSIQHIKRIRFHTRFPIGIPERIDDRFVMSLQKLRKRLVFVVHVNHQKEIDDEVRKGFSRLSHLGIPLLSQTVLLRGVNDSDDVLESLMSVLGDLGVIPYYLHQLDRVEGASHFEVSLQKGMGLVKSLHKRLPGYLVPRYSREIPGEEGKKIFPTFSPAPEFLKDPIPFESSPL